MVTGSSKVIDIVVASLATAEAVLSLRAVIKVALLLANQEVFSVATDTVVAPTALMIVATVVEFRAVLSCKWKQECQLD